MKKTAAIVPAPGVMYFHFAHTQWTPEAEPPENSTNTTAGDCSVDVSAVSSFHRATRGNIYWMIYMFTCDFSSLPTSFPKFRSCTLLHIPIMNTNYEEQITHVPS